MSGLSWQDGSSAKGPKTRTCIPVPGQRENRYSQVTPDSYVLVVARVHTFMNTQRYGVECRTPAVLKSF